MSSSIDVNHVLAQIRALSAQTQGYGRSASVAASENLAASGAANEKLVAKTQTSDFASLASQTINQVNSQQQQAGQLQNSFELGDPSVDLATVMLASTKAQVSFRGMVEVRNRLVNAYQEVMNLPL